VVPVQHGHCLISFQLKAAIHSRSDQTVDGGFTPSNARVFRKLFSIRTSYGLCGFGQAPCTAP
jgi:hypothetical protein